ncbi:outer membrane protein OmpA-like peptidoglycan-associated protein/tetratricopeptide (TPR) repeat protein [Saonia flava]|uniref:Outer membrane protein OmpA-like peptidoglycan-associated protein/tetratricopeptide (TPR) repeat protein n=1 Tax=Saonia flava TaxID=523696 RepID=A0A846QVV5_9FLAO|nr:OmpA family protein [Saonia flava]NJB72441.1 outer membrane protein OmpA-like peptidoglycan-associated protein/tetratricopeptide (TPR) repeat protein [Saonia flava]
MNKLKILPVILISINSFLWAQEGKLKKAKTNIDNFAFVEAISSYSELVKKGYNSKDIFSNLGNAHYLNANYKEAANWYGKLLKLNTTDIDAEYLYRYAQSLKSIEKYSESDSWMQKFNKAKADDTRALKFNKNKDYLEQIKITSGRYQIENLKINSKASDFSPSFYKNDLLVFSSARDSGIAKKNIHAWNDKPFLNLFKTDKQSNGNLKEPVKFSKKINKKTHESSPTFSKDGNTIYFTRNNSSNGNFSRDKKGISRLKVYTSTYKNGVWGNIRELPFNSNDYSVAHPTLNSDGTKLYFASDMPGSIGASDIYVVDIKKNGKFGTPQNLGDKINTEGNETFPFITDSNILYFASNGHPGLGGLDMFAAEMSNTVDSPVINLGEPINSNKDDFSLIIDETSKSGYFASNRKGGKGDDDIYSFLELKPIVFNCSNTIQGIVKDIENGNTLSNAIIKLINDKNEEFTVISNESGHFKIDLKCGNKFNTAHVSLEKYEYSTINFNVLPKESQKLIEVLLSKVKEEAPLNSDLFHLLNLNPIYFETNSSYIKKISYKELDKIVTYLKDNKAIRVDVRSHTDSRGSDKYNLWLSNKRAKQTMDYIISKGIDKGRLTGKGYGESQILNNCSNSVKCSEEDHQINRRSEFIVVE